MKRAWLSAVLTGTILCFGVPNPGRADQTVLVANTKINGPTLSFDWPALEIGIGSYEEGPTGLTIVRFKDRASVAVDVRGGAPGTVNTDGLRNAYGDAFTDAIVIAGGSAYGEEAITAVQSGLKELGLRGGDWSSIAFVPGAVIFDFGGRRLNEIYPDKRLAQAALGALRPGVFPLGAQGAGRMAMQGGYFGCFAHSGQGGAFRQVGQVKIAAFVVVNAYGGVTDRDGRLVNCHRAAGWGKLAKTSELLGHLPASLKADWEAGTTQNTTISLVVTNQKLFPWQLQRLAVQVHTSMGRGIQPFSTQLDGDTLFAASTQEIDGQGLDSATIGAIASEVMWDAILASVPQETVFAPPSTPPAVAPSILAAYAGRYDFALSKDVGDMRNGGVGLNIAPEKNGAKVLRAFAGAPAATAGAVTGDVITHVDDTPLAGLSLNQMIGRLRGPVGSAARLKVLRKDQTMQLYVRRDATRMLLDVRVEQGKLVAEAVGPTLFEFLSGKAVAVVPVSEQVFYFDGRYRTQLAFTKDASGKVSGVILNPGPWEQRGTRVD